MIELIREHGMTVDEGRMSADDLRDAEEVIVCSTAGGVMPVTRIDQLPVGSGTPGPLSLQLRDQYWARHDDPKWSSPVRYAGPRLSLRDL